MNRSNMSKQVSPTSRMKKMPTKAAKKVAVAKSGKMGSNMSTAKRNAKAAGRGMKCGGKVHKKR